MPSRRKDIRTSNHFRLESRMPVWIYAIGDLHLAYCMCMEPDAGTTLCSLPSANDDLRSRYEQAAAHQHEGD
jgi:hypothetical protein